jgi:hypothetical protein
MKGKILYSLFIFLVCLLTLQDIRGQESQNLYSNSFTFGVNSDAFTGMELGYQHYSIFPGIPSYYYIKLNVPLLLSVKQKKVDTWEIKAGTSVELFQQNNFILLSDFNLFSIKHSQILGTFLPFGINIKLTPGFRTKNGYIGFQTRFKQVLVTYIRHSGYVKKSFDEIHDSNGNLIKMHPSNGIYAFTGHHLYYGIEGMFKISKRMNMYFDLGMINYLSKYTGNFDAMMYGQIPIYTHVQFNYKINQNENN